MQSGFVSWIFGKIRAHLFVSRRTHAVDNLVVPVEVEKRHHATNVPVGLDAKRKSRVGGGSRAGQHVLRIADEPDPA